MVNRFGDFELDRDARELRLNGREIPLQPRVFDLLVYLIEHQDRVVGKAELLEALWPDVIVTDASVQRAVSLARAALQQGGLGHAIRTHSRLGYRFCAELPTDALHAPAAATASQEQPASLEQAEQAYWQQRWSDAVRMYERIDRQQPLEAGPLERWAQAAQCIGHLAAAIPPLERAAAAYSACGEPELAARATLALSRAQLESLEPAIARGCLKRAERLLADLPVGEAHGHLAWMQSRFCLFTGDLDAALVHAMEAQKLGENLGNCDIETMGLLYRGVSLQAAGKTRAGAELQDEAAAAVLSGDVSPLIGGIVYCGLIAGCCSCGDWERAEQWTESFTRWCQRSHIDTFAGACLLHRAEVFTACGELERAEQEISEADEILHLGAPWAIGDAARLQGDLHLMRGEFDTAEQAYRQAHKYGWNPYPGYALLLHQRGRTEEAIRGLLRCSEDTRWALAQRKACYLAHAAWLSALIDDLAQAGKILAQLDAQPELWEEGAVVGQIYRARAEMAETRGELEEAIRLLRDAVTTFQQKRAPLEAAIVRIRLAELLARNQELECADLELATSEALFQRSGASWLLQQCRQIRQAFKISSTTLTTGAG